VADPHTTPRHWATVLGNPRQTGTTAHMGEKKHHPLMKLQPLKNHHSLSVTGGEAKQCPFPCVLVDDQDLLQQLVVISRHTSNGLVRGSG